MSHQIAAKYHNDLKVKKYINENNIELIGIGAPLNGVELKMNMYFNCTNHSLPNNVYN